MLIVVVEHLPHEGAGLLARLAAQLEIPLRTIRLHAGDALPERLGPDEALVVLGGDMNTDEGDRFPHLHDERALLRSAIADQRPVLGICLGAQLLAEAAGGEVRHVGPICGYQPLFPTSAGEADPLVAALPPQARVLNLNGDHIVLGETGELLAASPQFATQVFRVGPRAYGVQFHPEFDAPALRRLLQEPSIEPYLRAGGLTGDELLAQADGLEQPSRDAAETLLRGWLDLATSAAEPSR